MGSIPIIQKRDYRAPESLPMKPDRARHYDARSGVERSISRSSFAHDFVPKHLAADP
jgi:hypothetical protein